MYLSHLLIDLGSNPDRPRPGRLWLRNIYHVHQRLSMAFPSAVQKEQDPYFIQPYSPDGFAQKPRFLFRIDTGISSEGSRAVILVQSELQPDWDYAFQNARIFLAAPPSSRLVDFSSQSGKRYQFSLMANPTLKKSGRSTGTKSGPRIGLIKREDQMEWIKRKATQHGFELEEDSITIESNGISEGWKASDSIKLLSVRFDGILTVSDSDLFSQALANGIGSAKGFGFGLLSVAPIRFERG